MALNRGRLRGASAEELSKDYIFHMWLARCLVMNGKAVEQGPRNILKRLIKEAAEEGLQMKSGVEGEAYAISPPGCSGGPAVLVYYSPAYLRHACVSHKLEHAREAGLLALVDEHSRV